MQNPRFAVRQVFPVTGSISSYFVVAEVDVLVALRELVEPVAVCYVHVGVAQVQIGSGDAAGRRP